MLWRLTKGGHAIGVQEPYDYPEHDLIALRASKEGVLSNVLFGEIPEKVARYPHTPVMIVQRYEGPVKSLAERVMG